MTSGREGGAVTLRLDQVPVPMAVLDGESVLHGNAALAELCGHGAVAGGANLVELVLRKDRPRLREFLALETLPNLPIHVRCCDALGAERLVALHACRLEGGHTLITVLPSERQGMSLVRRLSEGAVTVASATSEEAVYDCARKALDNSGIDFVVLGLVDDRRALELQSISRGDADAAAVESSLGRPLLGMRIPFGPKTERCVTEKVALWEEPLQPVFGVASAELLARQLLHQAPGLLCPLVAANESQGVMVFFGPGLSRSDAETLSLFANKVALALKNLRLMGELRRRVAELSLLQELGARLTGSIELEKVLENACESLRAIIDASNAFILLFEPTANRLVGAYSTAATRDELSNIRLAMTGPSLAVRAFREARAVQVADTRTGDGFSREMVQKFGEKALLALPLMGRHGPVGAVMLDDTRRPRRFTQEEIDRASTMANQVAAAIENARLYESLKSSFAELARTQEELVRAERLAALGELSAAVAHEVRNPLGVLFNSIAALRKRSSKEAEPLLDAMYEESDRLNQLVGDLLDFSRPPPPVPASMPVERLVNEAIGTMRATAPDVQVRLTMASGLTCRCAPAQLRRALVNLLLNAAQAMKAHGAIDFEVSAERREGGDWLRMVIADDGPGIPESVLPRIFEPFFTTRATGTGLGLALVKRIVDDHHGTIRVERNEPHGTRVIIHLPA